MNEHATLDASLEQVLYEVKKTIVGAGHCEKEQIRLMLHVLLPKAEPPTHDAADALAIAVTHAHHRQSAQLKLKVAAR